MPESTTETVTPTTDSAILPDDHPLVKAHAAKKAELAAARQRIAAIEAAGKSDTDRVNDRIASLERETNEARAEALRMRFAAKHGINDEDAALFLTGSDEETLKRQAERLAAVNADKAADDRKRSSVVKGEGTTNSNPSGDNEIREFTRNLFSGAD